MQNQTLGMGDGQNVKTLIEEVQGAFEVINALYQYEQLRTDFKKGSYRMGYHIGQLNALGEARLRLMGMIERHGPNQKEADHNE